MPSIVRCVGAAGSPDRDRAHRKPWLGQQVSLDRPLNFYYCTEMFGQARRDGVAPVVPIDIKRRGKDCHERDDEEKTDNGERLAHADNPLQFQTGK